jgi:Mg-chelatase subunit ChlD
MNPDFPRNDREELEASVTAFVLGELAPEKAAQLRDAIARDPKLAALYTRLSLAAGLVRETALHPTPHETRSTAPLKLAEERRQLLLRHFKTIVPKQFLDSSPSPRRMSWAVPVGIAAVLVVIMGGMLLPSLTKAKAKAQTASTDTLRRLARLNETVSLERKRAGAETLERLSAAPDTGNTLFSANGADDRFTPLATRSARSSGIKIALPHPPSEDVSGVVDGNALAATWKESQDRTTDGFGVPADAFRNEAHTWNLQVNSGAPTTRGYDSVSSPVAGPSPAPAKGVESAGRVDEARKPALMRRYGLAPAQSAPAPENRQRELASARALAITEAETRRKETAGIPLPTPQTPTPPAEPGQGVTSYFGDDKQSPADARFGGFGGGAGAGGTGGDRPPEASRKETLGLVPNTAIAGAAVGKTEALAVNGTALGNELFSYSRDKKDVSVGDSLNAGGVVAAEPAVTRVEAQVGQAIQLPTLGDLPTAGRLFRGERVVTNNTRARKPVAELGKAKQTAASPAAPAPLDALRIADADSLATSRLLEEDSQKRVFGFYADAPDREGRETRGVTEEKLAEAESLHAGFLTAQVPKVAKVEGPAVSEPPPQLRVELQPLEDGDTAAQPPPAAPPAPQPEVQTVEQPFSTFSLNVSDVSFKLAAATLEKGAMPDPAGIRSEEFINAFDYRDPEPAPGAPMAFAWERGAYPFAQNRDLLRLSVKTAARGREAGRPLNLVLLLDNSGSMERADRVGIIREALRVLTTQLQAQDKFTVITFARTPRLWVDGVPGNEAGAAAERLGGMTPEGGTNLEEALNLAYQAALRHYQAGGVNRVVLLTDGAANLGNVDPGELKRKVEQHRKQGVALDGFGIGWEGYNDDLLEVLTRNGDGRYGFINSPAEAATEFAGQLAGALQVAASDLKVQVEFNPSRVTAYRQIGYAKHQLTKEQFRDNTVDAAEIGAAEAGNALYVVETNPRGRGPLATVRVRYRTPGTSDYREMEWTVPYAGSAVPLDQAGPALRLAAGASAFSEWLAASPYAGEVTTDRLLGLLRGVPETYGADPRPKKLEWMIRQAKSISGK